MTKSIAPDARIFVAGHRGLVGSALVRALEAAGFTNLLLATRAELDLRDQSAVNTWFAAERPQYVYLVAGTVGGILPNSLYPAQFVYDNLLIHATVVHAAYASQVEKLLYLGSSCVYPRNCPQPMREEYLLSGPLEPTNSAYAIAKIAGIEMCRAYRRQYGCNFITAMPTNLYGPNDNFHPDNAHVLPALMRKFHEAKRAGDAQVPIWGSGKPRREFLHVDDLAACCLKLMEAYEEEGHINVGTGEDVSVRELAELLQSVIYPGSELTFDDAKPDGMPRKLLDVSRLHAFGWKHQLDLEQGIRQTYAWFVNQSDASIRA